MTTKHQGTAKDEAGTTSGLDKYRTFFVQSGDPMQMLKDGKFLECNTATARELGYESTGEFLNVHPAELSPKYQPDGKTSFSKAFEMMELAHANGTHRFEWMHKRKSGEEFPVEVMLTSVVADGEKYLYSVWTDISDRKQAEEARRRLESQLRHSEKMKAVGQLAGGVAHDFNNLLQAIVGYGELALRGTPEESGTNEDIQQILKAAKSSAELVGQLLAFGRRQVLKLSVLDVDLVIEEFAKMVRRLIGEHITFTFRVGPGVKTTCADRGQIEQVLMNLCVNARDAMPEGGELIIESETIEVREAILVDSTWIQPGEYVVLRISDTGTGMDDETQRHIFEPFYTRKKDGEGTGLGLSTVYGIVRQHEGMLSVVSSPGEGTTFEIYLPASDSPPVHEESTDASEARGGTEVILLAEDDERVRNANCRILESSGYTVITASDGAQAIALIDEHAAEVDMAVLDVVMPFQGGAKVLEHIRRKGRKIPILFASAYSSGERHQDIVLEEGIQLIRQPFHRDDFLKKIRQMLGS